MFFNRSVAFQNAVEESIRRSQPESIQAITPQPKKRKQSQPKLFEDEPDVDFFDSDTSDGVDDDVDDSSSSEENESDKESSDEDEQDDESEDESSDESEDEDEQDDESEDEDDDESDDEQDDESESEDEDNQSDNDNSSEEEVEQQQSVDESPAKESTQNNPEPPMEPELTDPTSDSDSGTDSDNESVTLQEIADQKINERTEPTILHEDTDTKFYYLSHKCEESEHLTHRYSHDVPDEGVPIVLYLYTLCDHHYLSPFVSVLLQYNEEKKHYDFPQFLYKPEIREETDNDDAKYHDSILEKCLQQVYTIFDIKPNDSVDLDLFGKKSLCYKGHLVMEDNAAAVFMIDVTPYLLHFQKDETYLSQLFVEDKPQPPPYIWSLIDELLKEKTYNTPINPVYANFLFSDDHKFLRHIQNDGKDVSNPKLMYNCYKLDGDDDKDTFHTKIFDEKEHIHLLPTATAHPVLGDMVFFSRDPLQDEAFQQMHNVDRYVVFVDKPVVFEGKPDTWDVTKIQEHVPQVLQGDNEDKDMDVNDAFAPSTKETGKKLKEIKAMYSAIQFSHNKQDIYGIKSSNFFCIL